jgi:hypothetical protein
MGEWPPLISGRTHNRLGLVPSLRDLIYPMREEPIYSVDRSGAERPPSHNTSRQKSLPSLIDED